MAIGYLGVADYVNTTSGEARGVIAWGYIGGAGVVVKPSEFNVVGYICTEDGERLLTEDGNYIVTENFYNVYDYICTESGERLETEDGSNNLVTQGVPYPVLDFVCTDEGDRIETENSLALLITENSTL